MKHYRYGSFKLCNHWLSLIVVMVFLTFFIVSIALNLSIVFVIFPAVCAFIRLFTILKPYCERFYIDDETIIVCSEKNEQLVFHKRLL